MKKIYKLGAGVTSALATITILLSIVSPIFFKREEVVDNFLDLSPPKIPSTSSLIDEWVIVERNMTWNLYRNIYTGMYRLNSSTCPVNYQDENGTWTPINRTFKKLDPDHPAYQHNYIAGNEEGLFNVYFKEWADYNWNIAFTYNKSQNPNIHVLKQMTTDIGYFDDSTQNFTSLQSVQHVKGKRDGDKGVYPGIFTGVNLTFTYLNKLLKEDFIISNETLSFLQQYPPTSFGIKNKDASLTFKTRLNIDKVYPYNGSYNITKNVTINKGKLSFKDGSGEIKFSLPVGDVYELYNKTNRSKLTYRIEEDEDDFILYSSFNVIDLSKMKFPVVYDPSPTFYSDTDDGMIYTQNKYSYEDAKDNMTGTVDDSSSYYGVGQYKSLPTPTIPSLYSISRGYLFFDTSALPKYKHVVNASLVQTVFSASLQTHFKVLVNKSSNQNVSPHKPLIGYDYNHTNFTGTDCGSLYTGWGTLDFTIYFNETGRNWINSSGIY